MSTLYEKFVKPNNSKSVFNDMYMKAYNMYKAHNDTLVFHDGTDNEMIFVPIEVMDRYKCVILSRADFDAVGRDASALTDSQLENIAQHIGETLVEHYFWESLEFWVDEYDLPKIDDEYDNE